MRPWSTPWDPVLVQRKVAERMVSELGPTAWAIDEVSVPKDDHMAVGVAEQYCEALGRRAHCQVTVSVQATSGTASCPLQWRLFLPREWATDADRRAQARIPPDVTHREKWRLALAMLDGLAAWGMTPPAVVAGTAYGTNALMRTALTNRQIPYVLAVRNDLAAHSWEAAPTGWPSHQHSAPSVAALAADLGQEAYTTVTWRRGAQGIAHSRFAALSVRTVDKAGRRSVEATVPPTSRLLIEWPVGADAPTGYWLSNLPTDTPISDLVRLAKSGRIGDDRRDLRHSLGLDSFEGRSWPAWHHHVTLATAAQAFLIAQPDIEKGIHHAV